MSVASTGSYCSGSKANSRPSDLRSPCGAGRSGTKRKRSRATTAASGIFARRPRRSRSIVCWGPEPGAKPRGCTVRSRAKLRSNSSSIERRKLAPIEFTATTRARPIIRPVAVAAVRPGFERAASAARRPSTPKSLRSGHDSTRASGAMTNGDASAIPKKIAIVPVIPAAATTGVVSSAAPSQNAPPSPSTISATPATARRARGRERRPSVPSTARIGDVRPARLAGHSAPSTEVATPVAAAAATAQPTKRTSPTGTSSTSRVITTRPCASATPSPSPRTVPITPSSAASIRTVRVTIPRVAPSVRSIPISRMRCSTVMLNELKMRKPPTNSAIAAKK